MNLLVIVCNLNNGSNRQPCCHPQIHGYSCFLLASCDGILGLSSAKNTATLEFVCALGVYSMLCSCWCAMLVMVSRQVQKAMQLVCVAATLLRQAKLTFIINILPQSQNVSIVCMTTSIESK